MEGSALHDFELEARNGLHRGKVLVVENIDRLSRQGAKAAAQLIWSLNEAGVDVATYHDSHIYQAANNSDMMDLFKVIILAQQAYDESDKKSKRTKASWDDRFNAIENGNQKPEKVPHMPNWVKRVDGAYVLDEHRTKVLNEIFDLYINGVGIHRIVTILNERGEPSWTSIYHKRNVNGWFYSYIYRLLTKRTVLGEYVTSDGRILATDFYPQAVTAEKFNLAQAALGMRKGNQKRTGTNRNRNLLSQLVVCSECGGGAHFNHTTDTVQKYTKVSGEVVNYRRKTYRKMRCDRARRKHNCDNQTILNYDVIEKTVLDELLPLLVDKPTNNRAANELSEKIAELARLKDANQSRLDNLIDAVADGGSKALVQRIEKLEADMERQAAEIDEWQKQLAIELAQPSNDDDIALVDSLRDELISDDDEIRTYTRGRVNIALRRLLHRIDILPNDTFRIWSNENAWWLFDDAGTLLEGEQTLAAQSAHQIFPLVL
ncbi:hypothetical protein ATE66_09520 [Sphingopyxis sp. H107]|nr:hypothetical protein ATE61_05520 [Sphingopyxis sp. H057]KTE54707.1 hypothetical protein ATE64_05515 [Sphingopyxis sp. H073]KTE60110.1 hypothetical protein ATE66_09520 [Sphingopyxis sp. H107]KTE67604.1 hypothetical protein ATE60_19235 [Sphingopyxis sp. H081]KTE67851.1 hypothetical protein ATE65_00080 [Sphingopyxis sp. H100]KTE82223.1 hypothetical protein ATE63_05135 [Sphingopyxis sp. H067]